MDFRAPSDIIVVTSPFREGVQKLISLNFNLTHTIYMSVPFNFIRTHPLEDLLAETSRLYHLFCAVLIFHTTLNLNIRKQCRITSCWSVKRSGRYLLSLPAFCLVFATFLYSVVASIFTNCLFALVFSLSRGFLQSACLPFLSYPLFFLIFTFLLH